MPPTTPLDNALSTPAPTAEVPAAPARTMGRRSLGTGLAAAAVSVLASRPTAADAAPAVAPAGTAVGATTPYQVGRLTPADRHLLRRFSYGLNGRLGAQVAQAGGAAQWFEQQLTPALVDDAPGSSVDKWYPTIFLTPQQMWARYTTDRSVTSTTTSEDFTRYSLARRMVSNRQVLEVMTEFWSNLLHIPSPNDKCWPWRRDYDGLIRTHALGRFDEMLKAAVLHPAMLLYLDNWASTKDAPNENLGREVLELHTVGRRYSEADVLNSTHILTGWSVDKAKTWAPVYKADTHWVGPVEVLGFSAANGSADGRQLALDYLDYLANHPATAQRVARRLVVRFVSDDPSPSLVSDIADVFQSSGTDIKATLRALVNHPEFLSSAAPKVRTPAEDYVATVRALRMWVKAPAGSDDFANWMLWQACSIGQRPFNWPTPDGFPDVSDAWASATRMLGSWSVHHSLASSYFKVGATYKPYSFWLPQLPLRFDQFLAAVSTLLLFEVPDDVVLNACAKAVGVLPGESITASHKVVTERMPLLLACLLDSSLHMNR